MNFDNLAEQTADYWAILEQYPWLETLVALSILAIVSWVLGRIARLVVSRVTRLLSRQRALLWLEDLHRNKVFRRLAQSVPSLVVQFGLPWVPGLPDKLVHFLGNIAFAVTVTFLLIAVNCLLNALLDMYSRTTHARTRSIKGYIQLGQMALLVFGAIIVIAIIIDRSPLLLLSGLGAMSAVLMLVYKDTLLSFVASVQLTGNDMLQVGDWIEMPQVGADGDVIDVTLNTVKVQNFDKTIVTIPTWRLMSESFKNWRGMEKSGGRRIKRSIYVDSSQIRFLSEEEVTRLMGVRLLREYIARKQKELQEWNKAHDEGSDSTVLSANRRRLTNIGTFRAYALAYLQNHPDIHPNMTCMVRQLQPTHQGIPLEIYCFTKTTAWLEYERIQGDVFDYLISVMQEFGLSAFQEPSGHDLRLGLQGMAQEKARLTASSQDDAAS